MSTYRVSVDERIYRMVEVEAEDEDAAIAAVKDRSIADPTFYDLEHWSFEDGPTEFGSYVEEGS